MAEVIDALKGLRLYGMAACWKELQEHGGPEIEAGQSLLGRRRPPAFSSGAV